MMKPIVLVCLLVAAVLFGIAMLNPPSRINLMAGGLLAATLAFLIPAMAALD